MSMVKYGDQSHGLTYDVFLSFRGEDTRHNFIGYLRDALRQRGINAFFDDENLRIGEDISPALLKAIEESQISVIVFSVNYASSRWCLGELVKIIECTKRINKQIAFPIFYHVDPSDVRNQRNSYGEAMVAHQNRFGKDSENIKAWKAALSEAADLKGHHIHTGFEIDHIKEIVEKVHAKIAPKPLLVGENPVGLDQHIEKVKSLLDMNPNDNTICVLGICGLGGIGKTELAKALYNKIVHQFEAASFLANVREKSNKINGPEDLQQTLLSEMFEQQETELGSTSKGIYGIKHKLGKKKVLLILDDVDDMEQLKNLAGGSDWFGPGSRIIITTRDKGLLIGTHSFVVQNIYEMTELNDQHSLELFCRNAFGKSNPKTGYEALSSRASGYAKGLPLALKVIGSNLATRKSLKAWEHALKDYERIPRKGIQDVLKISYDVLEPYAQSVFLDIACFFKGERIEYIEEILDEFSATSNIEELVNKSLLNVDHGYLNMHDLIQDMGREIVRQESPNPLKRSRLWFHQDVIDVLLADDSGSDATQGIMLDPPYHVKKLEWRSTAFAKMNRLRILIIQNTTFSSEPKHLPNHLRLLDWENYPSKSFPPKFYPRNIVILNLPYSRLTFEEPFKQFSYLTVMNISNNQSITTVPDVSNIENLRELRLENCKNLNTVHESIGFLKHLVHLSAAGCTKLENFLQRMYLPSLEVLDLSLCVKLEHFPDIVNKMNKPLKVYMINTSIKRLPDSIDNLIGLVSIEMSHSKNLKHLPSCLFMLPSVVAFKFGGCSKLGESFRRFVHDCPSGANVWLKLKTLHFENSGLSDEDLHSIFTCFPKLEELTASYNNLVSLPVCIKESDNLTKLDVSGCNMLQKIPECTNLRILNVHGCVKLEHISKLPCTIRKIDAKYCFNFSRETSDMLWDQVKKDRHGLEIVMPRTEIPEWFDYRSKGGIPCLWVRGKFPNVALALVFQGVVGKKRRTPRQLVELHLVINGRCVPRKGYYNFRIEPNHVLICDLQLLFNDEEWKSLDALFLAHEWNQVQISYEASAMTFVTLSEWGIFVYKQGTIKLEELVQFMCPGPRDSSIANIIVPIKSPMKDQMMMIEEFALDEIFNELLVESMKDLVIKLPDLNISRELSKMAKDILKGKPLGKKSLLAWFLQNIKKMYDSVYKEKDEPLNPNLSHKNELVKRPMDAYVGETATSGHKGSLEAQVSDAQSEEIMMKIFLDGMRAGLYEVQNRFPSLDIDATINAAFKRGNWARSAHRWSDLRMMRYVEGIIYGLQEALLSFPSLDLNATLSDVLSKVSRRENSNRSCFTTTSTTTVWGPCCGSTTRRRWKGASHLYLLRGKGKPTTSSSYKMRCQQSHACYASCSLPMNLHTLPSQENTHASICLISSGARIRKNLWSGYGTPPNVYMYGSTGYMRFSHLHCFQV
ncbi:TMV resistance protein N-like isoform X2 [Vicia villosa]|uniref:TMV resistance protein N-like isoform X2 n=1 Tax=Vicia villosa TaxID=3911 RepID=UPI00273CEFB4|nr:TMV resistance protein N-like isoform X2 [Vicia villosa]